ncbi:glycosyltransferase family 4 protein [Microbacterium sp. NPDC019599]|uniref:glycosyltransferase family 4 protein n=1 Tax=Microbacterium sp. NPDC019599 TaxID=3154690 RepID=UPI0033FE77CE
MAAATRPTVYHVGRAGDIPGGMTQVVNAYLRWPFPNVTVDVIPSRGDPGDHVASAKRLVGALRRIRAIRRSRERAVIVVHLSERGSFIREGLVARYARRCGLPVIAHLHGSEFAAYERTSPDRVGKVLKASTRVITLSEETSEICRRHVSADIVTLVPNAIPPGRPVEKTRTVVFGGVVSHRKGIDVLQAAWREQERNGWKLIVAGPLREAELVDSGLPDAEFRGSLEHDALMALLDEAAVAVLPSRDEAMPMFILEAMARRACVISTTVGGIGPVLSDDCGVLVAPGSVRELSAALGRVMRDDAERERIAQRGLDRFESRFSATAVFPVVEEIWLDALEPRRRPETVSTT